MKNTLIIALWGVVALTNTTAAQQVCGFRRDGNGLFPNADPPLAWATDKNIVWAAPLPNWGNASPIQTAGKVFVGAEPGVLICVNAADGKILWQKGLGYDQIFPPDQLKEAARAQTLQKQVEDLQKKLKRDPTDLKLYARLGELCRTITADPKNADAFRLAAKVGAPRTHNNNGYSSPTPVTDGKVVCALTGMGVAACFDLDGTRRWIRLVAKPTHGWGHSASPTIVGDKVIVHINKTVFALNLSDGETAWTADGPGTWGTPYRVDIGGRPAVVTTGGDLIRVSDGKVTARRFVQLPWSSPVAQDGVLYYMDQKGCGAVQLPAELTDAVKLKRLWGAKGVPRDRYYASPVVVNGVLYGLTQKGILTAVDTASGKVLFSQKTNVGKGTYYPSLVLVGDKLLISVESGATLIIKASRTFEVVGKNKLEPFRSTPLPVGSRLYIRGRKKLYCIGQ